MGPDFHRTKIEDEEMASTLQQWYKTKVLVYESSNVAVL